MGGEPMSSTTSLNQTVDAASKEPTLLESILSTVDEKFVAPHRSGKHPQYQSLEEDWESWIQKWVGSLKKSGQSIDQVRYRLSDAIGELDSIIAAQVNSVLHHPQFQDLESNWRGLKILCDRADELQRDVVGDESTGGVDIRMLSVTKREVRKDFDNAVEFDQSQMFKKIYEEEFGMSGGTPYGLLLANFEFTNHPNDIDMLNELSGVGAAAFCPVITSATPEMLGISDFSKLDQPLQIDKIFQQTKFRKWQTLRKNPDTQFLGVTLPRILMRLPHDDDGASPQGFRFREDLTAPNRENYLWGPASWGFACVVLRAYLQSGWFADIRGMQRGVDGGGVVTEFPTHSFSTDQSSAAQKTSVEVALSDRLEQDLTHHGFIPLSACHGTPFSAFYANQSVHEPQTYNDDVATMNARVSAMLQYVLCCSRISHFLRIEARNKIGSLQSAQAVEDHLGRWITDYVTPDEKASPEMKAKYPLLKAEIQVDEVPGKPGTYKVLIHLLPHYQLDALTSTMTLTAREISAPGSQAIKD
ncbi:hypothetical protein KOR42_36230 [Thalassoglobus neptunius]|uniref:Type VI secretion protein, EvpB/VC_A0108 family n=2 Tax=Thalassoglobus neptunius TaxID=1938619 RepID=A0A5C5WHP1_9PLAN|nr:hypothetical protein KOR42_36230 [Thalassoglobus neptunius]